MKKLNNQQLIESYDYSLKKDVGFIEGIRYVFKNKKSGGDYLEIILYDNFKEWYFLLDNFPFPRKSFRHNLPYYSREEFEADLKRMKIDIPQRK